MELPSKLLEQIAHNTRAKVEEHMLIVMNKRTHEEQLSQPLQTNNKQFKIAVTFLPGYNGVLNVTNSNTKIFLKKTITNDEDFFQIPKPPGDEYFFMIKPNFSTLGSIIEFQPQGPIIGFVYDHSVRNLLAFNETKLYKECNLSPNLVVILSLDNVFRECDIAQGMIFKGGRSGVIQNLTLEIDAGYKNIEKFRGGIQRYLMNTKYFYQVLV